MELVELLVRMDCSGCERKIRKQLSKLKGVDNIDIDLRMNKVTVIGFVDRRKVLKAVRKTGKRAEFWQEGFTYNNSYDINDGSDKYNYTNYSQGYSYNRPSSYMGNYLLQHQAFKRTYNYEKHGYNHYYEEENPLLFHGTSSDEQASVFFSDENPNACSIM